MRKPHTKPAGVGEKNQYLVHNYNDNTIRFVLHYDFLVDAEILKRATHTIIEQVDILHASFVSEFKDAYWCVNDTYEEQDYFQLIKTQELPICIAEELAIKAIAPKGKTKLCCYLVQDQTSSAITLLISHLCVDGCDGKYVLGKIIEAYNLIQIRGDATPLRFKKGSRSVKQIYSKLSRKEYISLMHNPIPKVKSEFPYPTKEQGVARLVKQTLSGSLMKRAHEKAKPQNATLNDVLLTAYYRAYGMLPEVDETQAMSIMSMMDLRKHCQNGDSKGLSNITGSLPTVLPDGITGDFENTLVYITKATSAQKENPLADLEGVPLLHTVVNGIPMGVLSKAVGIIYGSMAMGFTNLGNIAHDFFVIDGNAPDYVLFGAPLKKKPTMQISSVSYDGACTLCVVGTYTEKDAELLQTLLDKIVEQIKNYVEG